MICNLKKPTSIDKVNGKMNQYQLYQYYSTSQNEYKFLMNEDEKNELISEFEKMFCKNKNIFELFDFF